jgi:hypothetical protein
LNPFSKTLLLICALVGALPAMSATNNTSAPLLDFDQFRNVTWLTEHGLPRSQISDIEQTGDGYIWISTPGGLARFDGLKFVTFDSSNTPSFKTRGMDELRKDGHGNLWIVNNDGVVRFNPTNGFKRFEMEGSPEAVDPLTHIALNEAGDLLCLRRNVLYRFDGTAFEIVRTNNLAANDYDVFNGCSGGVLLCSRDRQSGLIIEKLQTDGSLQLIQSALKPEEGPVGLVEWSPGEFVLRGWP